MKNLLPNQLHCMTPQFVVSDLGKSIQFYQDKLGFKLTFKYEEWFAVLECGGKAIHLKLGSPLKSSQKWKKENEHVDMTFGVENIESLYASLDVSTEIIKPLRTMPYGTEFCITDPDGYIFAFLDMDSKKTV